MVEERGMLHVRDFYMVGKKMTLRNRVGNDVPGSRVTTTVPVACGYVESFIEKVSPHLQ